jgi:hypothetical protein
MAYQPNLSDRFLAQPGDDATDVCCMFGRIPEAAQARTFVRGSIQDDDSEPLFCKPNPVTDQKTAFRPANRSIVENIQSAVPACK